MALPQHIWYLILTKIFSPKFVGVSTLRWVGFKHLAIYGRMSEESLFNREK